MPAPVSPIVSCTSRGNTDTYSFGLGVDLSLMSANGDDAVTNPAVSPPAFARQRLDRGSYNYRAKSSDGSRPRLRLGAGRDSCWQTTSSTPSITVTSPCKRFGPVPHSSLPALLTKRKPLACAFYRWRFTNGACAVCIPQKPPRSIVLRLSMS